MLGFIQGYKNMRKISLLTLLVLLLSSAQLFAQPKEKTVVIGTFAIEKNAQRALKRLKETFNDNEEMVELQKSANFHYVARKSGLYYIVAIEPVVEYDVLNGVLSAARDTFADAFVNIMTKEIEVEITDDGYSVDETEELESRNQEALLEEEERSAKELVQTQANVIEENEEDVLDNETSQDNTLESDDAEDSELEELDNDDAVEDDIEVEDVTDDENARYIKPHNEEKSASILDDENLYMYIGAGVVLLLLIIIILKRKKLAKSKLKTDDSGDLSNIILDDTATQNSMKEQLPFDDIQEDSIENDIQAPAETLEVEEAIEKEPQKEVVKKPINRKIRDVNLSRGKIQKSDFNKFEGARILIAEDNLINQKVIMGLLGDSGIELVIAEDGQIALDILADDKNFHMVLMDAHMPNVDGFEATRAIRADSSLEHIAVVALSGDTSVDDIRKMNEAGMEATLEKPLKMDALYDIFYCYLNLDTQEEEPVKEPAKESIVESKSVENSMQNNYVSINHEVGIDIAGDEEMHGEIMREFALMYGESDTQIFEMVQEENYEDALRLLLDIQGLAGSIGAGELYECATLYRVAIHEENTEKMEKMQNKYSKEFLAVVSQIEAYKS